MSLLWNSLKSGYRVRFGIFLRCLYVFTGGFICSIWALADFIGNVGSVAVSIEVSISLSKDADAWLIGYDSKKNEPSIMDRIVDRHLQADRPYSVFQERLLLLQGKARMALPGTSIRLNQKISGKDIIFANSFMSSSDYGKYGATYFAIKSGLSSAEESGSRSVAISLLDISNLGSDVLNVHAILSAIADYSRESGQIRDVRLSFFDFQFGRERNFIEGLKRSIYENPIYFKNDLHVTVNRTDLSVRGKDRSNRTYPFSKDLWRPSRHLK